MHVFVIFVLLLPSLVPHIPICSVPLVPPSGSGDDNYPANWGFVSPPVLIIHVDDSERFKIVLLNVKFDF